MASVRVTFTEVNMRARGWLREEMQPQHAPLTWEVEVQGQPGSATRGLDRPACVVEISQS